MLQCTQQKPWDNSLCSAFAQLRVVVQTHCTEGAWVQQACTPGPTLLAVEITDVHQWDLPDPFNGSWGVQRFKAQLKDLSA